MSNLLISEPPLQVLPSLAVKVGLNEAIVLQQMHYWLQRSTNIKQGKKWIYNSISEWNKQFPFWSRSTLKRTISSLEKQKILITDNFNKAGFDKTKWYRIDYSKLVSQRLGQNEPTSGSNRTNGSGQNEPTNTKRLPENTTEKKHMSDSLRSSDRSVVTEVLNYLNEKADKRYTAKNKATVRFIRGRLREGYKVDDFKRVIDTKVAQWIDNKDMKKYLRPETLFNETKFESYLNEPPEQPSFKERNSAKKEISKGVYEDDQGDISW